MGDWTNFPDDIKIAPSQKEVSERLIRATLEVLAYLLERDDDAGLRDASSRLKELL